MVAEACPLCCEDCCLETEGPEWVPEDTHPAHFPFNRMVHMVDACTNCGQCSEVCPYEIPVSKIFATVNKQVKDIFGYYSGVKTMIKFTIH